MHVVAPELRRCTTELLRVIAQKEKSRSWRWWKTVSRGRTKQCPLWLKERRRCRNGTSRSREEEEPDEGIIKEKASAQEDAKATAQRKAGQSVKQHWDCSQIENEEEEEEEGWQKEFGTKKDGRKLLLQVGVMQKVPELVVHARMSQGEEVRGTKEKKKVKGWPTEDTSDKAKESSGGRRRRNGEMERFESGGDGSVLEEIGGKNGEEVMEKYKVCR